MASIRRGDIYWVDFGPVTSSAPAKSRPFLIVQLDDISSTAIKTVIGCAIKTLDDRLVHLVFLVTDDWHLGYLVNVAVYSLPDERSLDSNVECNRITKE